MSTYVFKYTPNYPELLGLWILSVVRYSKKNQRKTFLKLDVPSSGGGGGG
jgi:hypothetical protein